MLLNEDNSAVEDAASGGTGVTGDGQSVEKPAVQTSTEVQTNTNQSVPNEAFAAIRKENEVLSKQLEEFKRFKEDEGVKEFLAQRQKAAQEAEAKRLGVPEEAAKKIAELEAYVKANQERQYQTDIQANAMRFKSEMQMSDVDFNTFIQ